MRKIFLKNTSFIHDFHVSKNHEELYLRNLVWNSSFLVVDLKLYFLIFLWKTSWILQNQMWKCWKLSKLQFLKKVKEFSLRYLKNNTWLVKLFMFFIFWKTWWISLIIDDYIHVFHVPENHKDPQIKQLGAVALCM